MKKIVLLFLFQINFLSAINYQKFVRFLHKPHTIVWAACGAVTFCNLVRLGIHTDLFTSKKELEENRKKFQRQLELEEELAELNAQIPKKYKKKSKHQ